MREPPATIMDSAAEPPPVWRTRALAAGIVLYALAAAAARPLTDPSAVTVLVPGLLLFVHGARRTPRRTVRANRITAAVWLTLALAVLAWELVAYAWGNDAAHPTLSLLADPVLDTYPGRLAGYLLWLGTGAWLVSR